MSMVRAISGCSTRQDTCVKAETMCSIACHGGKKPEQLGRLFNHLNNAHENSDQIIGYAIKKITRASDGDVMLQDDEPSAKAMT